MRIAYLVSRYPAVSHTFIRREVAELRRKGADVQTFSVRRPERDELVTPADHKERSETWFILPVGALALIRIHLRALARWPGRYVRTLVEALRHRPAGTQAAVKALFHFAEAIRLAGELEARNITRLHNHFSNSGGNVGYLASRFLDIDWSLTLHGAADFDGPMRMLLGEKIAGARFVACASQYAVSQAMRASTPEHWDKLFVSRCGIDMQTVMSLPREPDTERLPTLLCVGRLSPEKGHYGLLTAAALLREQGERFELHLAGDGPERGPIERRIAELELGDFCSLAGSLSEEQVIIELLRADVFVLPSLMEGLPVVLMEAMACQLPVIAPRLSGIPELVEHEQNGLLYAPGDWAELARLIRRLTSDPEERARLGVRARERVERVHDIRKAVQPLWQRFSDAD